jgi:hypothetical protein
MTNSEQGKGKQGPVGEDGITQQEALSRYMQVTVMKGGQIDRLSNSRTAAATL